jgi:hypothetical protein
MKDVWKSVQYTSNYTYFPDAMDLQLWIFVSTVKASTSLDHIKNKDTTELKIQSGWNKTNEYISRELDKPFGNNSETDSAT